MSEPLVLTYEIPGNDFTRAGEASSDVKRKLKKLGMPPEIVRKAAIGMYEGEINLVIHGGGGTVQVTILPQEIEIRLIDHGPGIADISLAMQEGFSTASESVRNLGFGAGMGLPNMKKYSDDMQVESVVGEGTTVTLKVFVPV